MSKERLKEPYLGSVAICLAASETLEQLHAACDELSYLVDMAKQARIAIGQLHEDWINWLEDPTQETLQPMLADLHDLKALLPRLHQEVLSFFEPADQQITDYLEGRTTLGELHATLLALKQDPDQMPIWSRAISEANVLELTALEAIVSSAHPTLCILYGLAETTSRASSAQPLA